jgi:hypothetical protein
MLKACNFVIERSNDLLAIHPGNISNPAVNARRATGVAIHPPRNALRGARTMGPLALHQGSLGIIA